MPRHRIKFPHVPLDFSCLNCDTTFIVTDRPRVFCTTQCANDAKLVRYVRAASADGRINDVKVMMAIKIKFAHALADRPYNQKARQLSPRMRAEIYSRDGNKCVICRNPGTEIDHINGDNSDPENLQLLCQLCHYRKTFSNTNLITDDAKHANKREKAAALITRIQSVEPIRICDNQKDWESIHYHPTVRLRWAKLLDARRTAFYQKALASIAAQD